MYYQNCSTVWWRAGCADRQPCSACSGRWPRPGRRPSTTRCSDTFAAYCVGLPATGTAWPVPSSGRHRRPERRCSRLRCNSRRRRRSRSRRVLLLLLLLIHLLLHRRRGPPGRTRNGPTTNTAFWRSTWATDTCRLSEPTTHLFVRTRTTTTTTRTTTTRVHVLHEGHDNKSHARAVVNLRGPKRPKRPVLVRTRRRPPFPTGWRALTSFFPYRATPSETLDGFNELLRRCAGKKNVTQTSLKTKCTDGTSLEKRIKRTAIEYNKTEQRNSWFPTGGRENSIRYQEKEKSTRARANDIDGKTVEEICRDETGVDDNLS